MASTKKPKINILSTEAEARKVLDEIRKRQQGFRKTREDKK